MATNYVKHGDFDFDTEKIQEIDRQILVVNDKKAFWGNFVAKAPALDGDKLTLRTQILIDYADKALLDEGAEPRLEQIKVVSRDVTPHSYGSYIKFSREAAMKNRDSVTTMAGRQLSRSRLKDTEAINAEPYFGTTFVATKGASDTFWDFLTSVAVRLEKNKGNKYQNSNFIAIVTPEVARLIKKEAKTDNLLNGTEEGKKLVANAYLGAYAGFEIYTNSDAIMYDETKAKSNCLFIAMNDFDEFPVKSHGADNANAEVIVKGLGSAGTADALDQYGTIGSRFDDIAAGLQNPELVIKAVIDTTYVTPDIPGAYDPASKAITSPATI